MAGGESETSVELPPGGTTAQLRSILAERFPSLAEAAGSITLAVNQEYLDEGAVEALKDGDEVALIPPISGG